MKNVLWLSLALAGCAGGWQKPGGTEAQFHQDRYQCQIQAAQAYPVVMSQIGSGYQAPATTNCMKVGNQVNCTTMPGAYTPPQQVDMNAISRGHAFDNCMRAQGYSRQRS